MSRTTIHAYMEAFSGSTISELSKDLYLNMTRPLVLSDMLPWGASHIQTNTAVDYVSSTAAVDYTQTEYAYPTSNIPMEISGVAVKYAVSASYKTARCVQPFEHGDDCANNYTDQDNPVYFLRNNKIIVYPQFTAVVADAIKVQMVQRLSELSSGNTTTGLSSEGEKLWAVRAVVAYFMATGDKKAAGVQAQYQEYHWALKKISPLAAPNDL
jgi:hypothetical protein